MIICKFYQSIEQICQREWLQLLWIWWCWIHSFKQTQISLMISMFGDCDFGVRDYFDMFMGFCEQWFWKKFQEFFFHVIEDWRKKRIFVWICWNLGILVAKESECTKDPDIGILAQADVARNMLPRELFVLATLSTLSVATSAASIDFDLGDYEVFTDTEERSTDDNDNVAVKSTKEYNRIQGPREFLKITKAKDAGLVRCYCNQPDCVSQSYLCMGRGCFTELSSSLNPASLRPEHSPYSGCLEKSLKERQCLPGYLCCEEDLCNHVDSPAVRSKLNKTLQVLLGDSRAFLEPIQPTGHGVQSTDSWFRTATIAVPICGLIVLLMLASLAIRLLQPLPNQIEKLGPHRMPDNAPPLLGSPKVPLVWKTTR